MKKVYLIVGLGVFLLLVFIVQIKPSKVTISGTSANAQVAECQKNQVSFLIPSVRAQGNDPEIISFSASNSYPLVNEIITLSWQTRNTEKVMIGGSDIQYPSNGSAIITVNQPTVIYLYAISDSCFRQSALLLDTVSGTEYPWYQAARILAAVIALDTLLPVLAALTPTLGLSSLSLWSLLGRFMDRFRKKKPWGVVYDSVTKKGLPRAIVRVKDASSLAIIQTTVTDAQGIFRLNTQKGVYLLEVTKNGYTFPSTLVPDKVDAQYTSIYKGEKVIVEVEGQSLMFSIPIDSKHLSSWQKTIHQFGVIAVSAIRWASDISLIIGIALSIAFAIRYPGFITFFILGLYILILVAKIVYSVMQPKQFGTVTTGWLRPVADLEIGLYDKDFNTFISQTYTNRDGKYQFIVPANDYRIKVISQEWEIIGAGVTNGVKSVIKPKKMDDSVLFVKEDIRVVYTKHLEAKTVADPSESPVK